MQHIHFFVEDINFNLKKKTKLRSWIQIALDEHQKIAKNINYIFTSDNYLLELNKSYLQHDTLTDIITFEQSVEKDAIEADIFISVERVIENAKNLNISFEDELHRVMIHGVLHLLGFTDKGDVKQKEMRKKENHYLALRF
jgi:rRNA maturation RNase YbeY